MKTTDPSPFELLQHYISQFDVPLSDIVIEELQNLNFTENTGRFDAAIGAGAWDTILENLVSADEPFTQEVDSVKALHKQIFENPTDSLRFDEHINPLKLSRLTEINASLFQFKQHPRFFVLYVNEQSELRCDSKISCGPDWILIEIPEINLNERSIIEIQYENKLVHILCTDSQVLVHTAISQPLPTPPKLPTFIPNLDLNEFSTNIIQLGYALRFPQSEFTTQSKQSFLDSLYQPIVENIPTIYRAQIESLFDQWCDNLESRMPTSISNDTEQIIEWLVHRDVVASLFAIVGQWKPIARERLNHLDEIFPVHAFSYLLPESTLLAEAWFQDPSCWWGQGAALGVLLDQSSSI